MSHLTRQGTKKIGLNMEIIMRGNSDFKLGPNWPVAGMGRLRGTCTCTVYVDHEATNSV